MKATAEWFPARGRGFAGGLFNIGASFGSMLAPPLVAWASTALHADFDWFEYRERAFVVDPRA